jgi:hypothetical protein
MDMTDPTNHPGMALVDRFRAAIYSQWRDRRGKDGGEDLAAFIFERGDHEVGVVVCPRQELLNDLTRYGVDFSNMPDLQKPASEDNPFPAMGLWIIVGLEPMTGGEAQPKLPVAITKFVEPLLARMGGGLTVGQA